MNSIDVLGGLGCYRALLFWAVHIPRQFVMFPMMVVSSTNFTTDLSSCRVIAVMGVQHEQEGAEHKAPQGSSVEL